MDPISVRTRSRLAVSYRFFKATVEPVSDGVIVVHHGICHTWEQFVELIKQLNARGFHVAMIDQQSASAGLSRNCIGAGQYRQGMADAVKAIDEDCQSQQLRIGSYVLHSMGAMIGEEMQQTYLGLERPTVLMAPIPVNGAGPVTCRLIRDDFRSFVWAVCTLNIKYLATTPEQVRRVFFDGETDEKLVEKTSQQLQHAPFLIYLQLLWRWWLRPWINNHHLHKRMLLYSDTDYIFHSYEFRKTRQLYRPLKRRRIPGGHDFFIQHAPETAEQIAKFCLRHAADPRPPIPRPHIRFARKPTSRRERMSLWARLVAWVRSFGGSDK